MHPYTYEHPYDHIPTCVHAYTGINIAKIYLANVQTLNPQILKDSHSVFLASFFLFFSFPVGLSIKA